MFLYNNLVGGRDSSSEKYNKDTYIGYLKMKNGGMKIIPGENDNNIVARRDKILKHLELVLSGGKHLKEKNIKKYFNALGGKFLRNDMCISGDNPNCNNGKNISINGAYKLLKLINKKKIPIDNAINIFKGSAPQLYEKLETKLKGGYNSIIYDNDKRKSSSSSKSSSSIKSSSSSKSNSSSKSINYNNELGGNSFFDIGNAAVQNTFKSELGKLNRYAPHNSKKPPGLFDWLNDQKRITGTFLSEFNKEKRRNNPAKGIFDVLSNLSSDDPNGFKQRVEKERFNGGYERGRYEDYDNRPYYRNRRNYDNMYGGYSLRQEILNIDL
jgi:hypothetical protein